MSLFLIALFFCKALSALLNQLSLLSILFLICSVLTCFKILLLVSIFLFCFFAFLSVLTLIDVIEIGYNPFVFSLFSSANLFGESVLYSTTSPVLVAALYLYIGIITLHSAIIKIYILFIFICIIVLFNISKFFSSNCDFA